MFHTGTGEHGVGIGKKEYLYEELGENTVEFMKAIKTAIDPLNIMNPEKVRHVSVLAAQSGAFADRYSSSTPKSHLTRNRKLSQVHS